MDGEIDLAAQERIFDFFDEQPLAADLASGTSRFCRPRFGCALREMVRPGPVPEDAPEPTRFDARLTCCHVSRE